MLNSERLYNGEKVEFANEEVNGYVKKEVRELIWWKPVYYSVTVFDKENNKWEFSVYDPHCNEVKKEVDVECRFYPANREYECDYYPKDYKEFLKAVISGDWKLVTKRKLPTYSENTVTLINDIVLQLTNELKKAG